MARGLSCTTLLCPWVWLELSNCTSAEYQLCQQCNSAIGRQVQNLKNNDFLQNPNSGIVLFNRGASAVTAPVHQQHQCISSISASAHSQHQCISSNSTLAATVHQHFSSNSAAASAHQQQHCISTLAATAHQHISSNSASAH